MEGALAMKRMNESFITLQNQFKRVVDYHEKLSKEEQDESIRVYWAVIPKKEAAEKEFARDPMDMKNWILVRRTIAEIETAEYTIHRCLFSVDREARLYWINVYTYMCCFMFGVIFCLLLGLFLRN